MDSRPELVTQAAAGVPPWRFVARGLWIALRLIAVFYLGQSGGRFFYQGF
ncbi:MAG: hypothetical protein ACLQGP_31225 [Isosphaeraceae bacterium]